jgi:DNA polymerase I
MTSRDDWGGDWLNQLPFREIWAVDGEWYPGEGLGQGGVRGDRATPFCLCAYEIRSRRLIKLRQHELGRFPPYSLGGDSLVVTYMLSADYGGIHLPLGWGKPAFAFDAYVEFRHITNDATAKSEDRKKGFYGLAGALRYFGEDELDIAKKKESRDRILQGPPFTDAEERELVDYCAGDTLALARLLPHLVSLTPSLKHAYLRAEVQWGMAWQEWRGVPMDSPKLNELRTRWVDIQADLVRDMDASFGCYEFDDQGAPHWRKALFADLVDRHRLSWPTLESGALDEADQTFREMCALYPFLEPLRELRYTISKLRLHSLTVGNDGRNRALLNAYGTKTGRNAPSATGFVFGPAKWIRHLIQAPFGRALAHRDFTQQEPRISAVLSDDRNLLAACEGSDLYLATAEQLGFMRESMDADELGALRALFKIIFLSISYGAGAFGLAVRAGISRYEAGEILARMRVRFHRYEDFCNATQDHAGLNMRLTTQGGWTMFCPSGCNPRTLRNFPIQSTAAEVLHVMTILAERRGIEIVAPIHDAIVTESRAADARDMAQAADRLMRDASALVLKGYELPSDCAILMPGQHFQDKRGASMWSTITGLLAKLARGAA